VAGQVVPGILKVLESCKTSRITCPITWVFEILHDRYSNHVVCTQRRCTVTLRIVVDIVGWNCVLQRNVAMLTANILPLLCWKLESYWRVSVDQVPLSVWNSCHQRPPQLHTHYIIMSAVPNVSVVMVALVA